MSMLLGRYDLEIENNYIRLPEGLVEMLGTKELAAIVADDRIMIWRADEFPEEVLHGDAYLYM